ncbi:MAG: hypothetical protein HZA15_14395 [Nitrospirae bacterium]|nr:hypothetical protein [Nitrospirota bacterium]
MKKKSLKETNPYLKDPELREALLDISVATSSAVEGIRIKCPKLSRRLEKKLRALIAVHHPSES